MGRILRLNVSLCYRRLTITRVATPEDKVPHCLGLLGAEGAAVVAKIEREVKAACFKQLF